MQQVRIFYAKTFMLFCYIIMLNYMSLLCWLDIIYAKYH